MGLETGTKITDLVSTNPLGTDDKKYGDDHIRLLKVAVKSLVGDVSQIGIGPASLTGKAGQVPRVNAGETNFSELTTFVEGEDISHAGSGTSLTLAGSPSPAASLQLFRNGVLLRQGVGKEYTVSGATVTLAVAIADSSEWFVAHYKK